MNITPPLQAEDLVTITLTAEAWDALVGHAYTASHPEVRQAAIELILSKTPGWEDRADVAISDDEPSLAAVKTMLQSMRDGFIETGDLGEYHFDSISAARNLIVIDHIAEEPSISSDFTRTILEAARSLGDLANVWNGYGDASMTLQFDTPHKETD